MARMVNFAIKSEIAGRIRDSALAMDPVAKQAERRTDCRFPDHHRCHANLVKRLRVMLNWIPLSVSRISLLVRLRHYERVQCHEESCKKRRPTHPN